MGQFHHRSIVQLHGVITIGVDQVKMMRFRLFMTNM